MTATYEAKLRDLLYAEGLTWTEMGEMAVVESVLPAICMNEDCDYVGYYEPDSTAGWCEECDTGTCKSGAILMGIM